jgi:hypothetical protein
MSEKTICVRNTTKNKVSTTYKSEVHGDETRMTEKNLFAGSVQRLKSVAPNLGPPFTPRTPMSPFRCHGNVRMEVTDSDVNGYTRWDVTSGLCE